MLAIRTRTFTTAGIDRRTVLNLCAPLPLLAAAPAQAQGYPPKLVEILVAFTAGGTTDIPARVIGQSIGNQLKQSFIIENKHGAGGNSGTGFVARAPAGGYTLLVNLVGSVSINQTLYKGLRFDLLKDFVPVVQIVDEPNVLVVPAALPVKNFD